MKKTAVALLSLICVFVFTGALSRALSRTLSQIGTADFIAPFTASVFFKDSVTAASLKKINKVKILIVPGHDAEFPGTEFNGLKEVVLNVALGEKLYALLKKEPAFDVTLAQTKAGYLPVLQTFFENDRAGILDFIAEHKRTMEYFVEKGEVDRKVGVKHNTAPSEVVMRLFGINKWANENGIDIVIHIHFNDYPGRKRDYQNKYTGFSIYVPESQFSNAKGSKSVAESVYKRLENFYPKSNLRIEDAGVIEDQELIAIGANNTLDGAGLLIEYGYIYEPAFSEPALRDKTLSDLALQTYLGVMDFFGTPPKAVSGRDVSGRGENQTSYVPYSWQTDLKKGDKTSLDVLSLQAALAIEGVYPPPGKDKNDCGLTGSFGPCTEKSVVAFQEKHEISPAEGFVGEKTREKLNELYAK